MHVGAWSPSSGPHKAPKPGSSVSLPLVPGPRCHQAPSCCGTHTGPRTAPARTSWRSPRPGPAPAARALWPPWSRRVLGTRLLRALVYSPVFAQPSGLCLFGDDPSLQLAAPSFPGTSLSRPRRPGSLSREGGAPPRWCPGLTLLPQGAGLCLPKAAGPGGEKMGLTIGIKSPAWKSPEGSLCNDNSPRAT